MSDYRYCLRGEIDLANAPELSSELDRAIATGAHLLVDCTHLTFIDSSGIRALLEAKSTLDAAGRHMLVTNVPRSVRRTFDVLGLTELLHYDRKLA